MNNAIKLFLVTVLLLSCSDVQEPYSPESQDEIMGVIRFNVSWPPNVSVSKIAEIQAVESIKAYVNSESGPEITNADLRHEGNRGKAEISVPAGNNYQVILVALESSLVKYIGSDEDVDIVAGGSTTADVSMLNAAPTLNPAVSTGDSAYSLSWSTAPFAVNYFLQEDDNSTFFSPSTAYSGSDTTKSFTDKTPGNYYYRVRNTTQYGTTIWSETNSVEVGANGTIIIDIPWPEEYEVDLSISGSLATNYEYSYVDNKLTVTGEVTNSGSADATNVSMNLIARNSSGTYMDELTESLGTISAGNSKGFNVTFPNNVFSSAEHPAATCDYTLTCDEGGPFTGSVNLE